MESANPLVYYTQKCTIKILGQNSVHTTCKTGNMVMDYQQGYLKLSKEEMDGIRSAVTSHGDVDACILFYTNTRKTFLDACLEKLRVADQELFKAPVSREEIEGMTDDCKMAVTVCAKVLFEKEKDLCNNIFVGDLGGAADPFTETVANTATEVFDFTEALINSITPSYSTLIPMLSLHLALSENLPLVEALFLSARLQEISKRARGLHDTLGKLVKKVVLDLPEILHNYALPTNRGTEPTIPRYVMKDIIIPIATKYRGTLSTLIGSSKPSDSCYKRARETGLDLVEIEGVTSPVDLHMMGIIANMVHHLKAISTLAYKDKELHIHLFTMTNLSYIVEKIEGCEELKKSLAKASLDKLDKKLQNAIGSYLKLSGGEISKCLHTHLFTFKSSTDKVAEFNRNFDEMYRSLVTIMVSDQQVRQKYRKYIAGKLVTDYAKFLEGTNLAAKYNAEYLESKITNCFRGSPNTSQDW